MKQYPILHTELYRDWLSENLGTDVAEPKFDHAEPIGSCQAWIVRDVANNVIALQSYNTIVSVCRGNGRKPVRLRRYSVTTSKHQCYFDRAMQ